MAEPFGLEPVDEFRRLKERYRVNNVQLGGLQAEMLSLEFSGTTATYDLGDLALLQDSIQFLQAGPERDRIVALIATVSQQLTESTGGTVTIDAGKKANLLLDQIERIEDTNNTLLVQMRNMDPARFAVEFPGFVEPGKTGGGAGAAARVPVIFDGRTFMVSPSEALAFFQDQSGQVQIAVPDTNGNIVPMTVDAATALRYYSDLVFQGTVSADTAATLNQRAAEQSLSLDFQRTVLDVEEDRFQRQQAQREFEFGVDTALALQGLDLQSKSLEIQALANALSAEIDIGRMTFDEARLNLDRVSEAMNQRRQDQLLLVESAVKQSSLRTDPVTGELVSQLPFSQQLATAFSQAFGQTFGQDQFSIAAGVVNPQQAGQDVIGSTEFVSPIPGLTESLISTTNAIQGTLAAPGPAAAAVTGQATDNLIGSL